MALRWLAILFVFCGLGTGAKADPWERELLLGMTPADLISAAALHGARIYDDESAGTLRIIVLNSQIVGQDTLLYVFFEDARARLINLDFYLRSHASPPYPTIEDCRRAVLSVAEALQKRVDFADLQPTVEAQQEGFGTTYTWRGPGMYAEVELGAPQRDECGWISASLFDGSEAELSAFFDRFK